MYVPGEHGEHSAVLEFRDWPATHRVHFPVPESHVTHPAERVHVVGIEAAEGKEN